MTKRALILGAGQDASYLADLLLGKQYEVHLLYRRSSVDNLWRVRHCLDRLTLHKGDLADPTSVARAVAASVPEEIYHLADQDHVDWSFAAPDYSIDITAGSVCRLLELVRGYEVTKPKVFIPLSATMFGAAPPPQNEDTPFAPASPYAVAKTAAFYLCAHHRREYGMHVSTAIFYNHDSIRRQGSYLLHKICRGAVRIARGEQESLPLGDVNMRVDIGYAADYVKAAWQMMQLDRPDDFVIATGHGWTVREMAEEALRVAGVRENAASLLTHDATFRRPGHAPTLIGDPAKARRAFGFQPKATVSDVIVMLVDHYREQP